MRKQVLKCPKCGYRLIDSSPTVNSKLFNMEVGIELDIDYFAKCKRCKAEIGIKKIEYCVLSTEQSA